MKTYLPLVMKIIVVTTLIIGTVNYLRARSDQGNPVSIDHGEDVAPPMVADVIPELSDASKLTEDDACDWANSEAQRQICTDDAFVYKHTRVTELLKMAMLDADRAEDIMVAQQAWEAERNACHSESCINRLYSARMRELTTSPDNRYYCNLDDVPMVVYRHGFTPEVVEREPVDYYTLVGPDVTQVRYFSEILGGRGSSVYHVWYKDGKRIAKLKFDVGGDRWRVWSSKNITDHNARWEVHIEDASGCLLTHEEMLLGNDTVTRENELRGGWHSPYKAFNAIIEENNNSRLEMIRLLSRTGDKDEYLRSRNQWGDTPLLLAVRVNNIPAVKMLLGMGASPYVWDANEKTALQLASELRHVEIADALKLTMQSVMPAWGVLKSHIEYKYADFTPDITTPLRCVTRTYHLKGKVLKHEWISTDSSGKSVSRYVSTMPIESNVSELGSDFLPKAENGQWSVKVSVDDVVKSSESFRITVDPEKGAKVLWNTRGIDTGSAVQRLGAAWAPIEMVAYVHEMNDGIDPIFYHKEYTEMTRYAVASGNISLVKYLYSQGWVKDNPSSRRPLLHHAVENRRGAMMQYLLSLGMDIDKQNRAYSNTPLHIAARIKAPVEAEILINWGADMNITNQGRKTPLVTALDYCAYNTAKVLLEHGARVSFPVNELQTMDELLERTPCGEVGKWKALFTQHH